MAQELALVDCRSQRSYLAESQASWLLVLVTNSPGNTWHFGQTFNLSRKE